MPKCGKEWRDRNNLNELTTLAWAKISILAENGNSDAQFLIALRYNGYDFIREEWNLNTERYNRNPYYDMEKLPIGIYRLLSRTIVQHRTILDSAMKKAMV